MIGITVISKRCDPDVKQYLRGSDRVKGLLHEHDVVESKEEHEEDNLESLEILRDPQAGVRINGPSLVNLGMFVGIGT